MVLGTQKLKSRIEHAPKARWHLSDLNLYLQNHKILDLMQEFHYLVDKHNFIGYH